MLKTIVTGYIGKDAEIREVSNQHVISFSVAHTEKFKDRSGIQTERTTWVHCSYWRDSGQTSVAQYLKKGTRVLCEGTPSTRVFTGASGQPQASFDLRVAFLELQGEAKPVQQAPAGQPKPAPGQTRSAAGPVTEYPATFPTNSPEFENDDLPF